MTSKVLLCSDFSIVSKHAYGILQNVLRQTVRSVMQICIEGSCVYGVFASPKLTTVDKKKTCHSSSMKSNIIYLIIHI